MQIMIDVNVESPEALDIAAEFLKQHAALKRAQELPTGFNTDDHAHTAHATPHVPTGTPAAPPVPPMPAALNPQGDSVPFPAPPNSLVPPPPSNVVPFPPAVAPSIPAPPVPAPAGAAAATLELDDSGMPWDKRIHSKNKSKKQDGTWRLLKNVDKALLESVTQELHARMVNSTASSVPAPAVEVPAPSFPGALPLPPAQQLAGGAGQGALLPPIPGNAGSVPVPPLPAPGNVFGKSPLPPGVTPAPLPASVPLPPVPPVPVPPAANVGLPDANNAGMVPPAPVPEQMSEYRAFVAKATQARADGRLSADAVSQIVQQAGAPSIQLLGNMAHLVPRAMFILDATLAGWNREQIAAHIAANGP